MGDWDLGQRDKQTQQDFSAKTDKTQSDPYDDGAPKDTDFATDAPLEQNALTEVEMQPGQRAQANGEPDKQDARAAWGKFRKIHLLTYVEYVSARRVRTYPQYVFSEDGICKLSPDTFPDRGFLPVTVAQDYSNTLESKLGNLALMRLNALDVAENKFYPNVELDAYNGLTNPRLPRGKSQIEFARFAWSEYASLLMQIVHVREGQLDFSEQISTPVHPWSSQQAPVTAQILIAQSESGKLYYYGPFEYSKTADKGYQLVASAEYDHLVYRWSETALTQLYNIFDTEGNLYTAFCSSDEIKKLSANKQNSYDWVSKDKLIEAMVRVSRQVLDGLSKRDVQKLRATLSTCSDTQILMSATPARRQRMLQMVDMYLSWQTMAADDKNFAIEHLDPQVLARYVFEEDGFEAFFERAKEQAELNAKIEAYEQGAAEKLRELRDKELAYQERVEQLCVRVQKLSDEYEQKKSEQMQSLAEATQEQEADLLKLRKQCEEAGAQKEELEAQVAGLEQCEVHLRVSAEKQLERLADPQNMSDTLVEIKLLQEILGIQTGAAWKASLNSDSLRRGTQVTQPVPGAHDEQGAEMALPQIARMNPKLQTREIIKIVGERLSVYLGREYDQNFVANLLICVTQGYITTLSGLPGTGKTSLAQALGWALGLSREDGLGRTAQVQVERGWTSYKDFIGYFNPLTESFVEANVDTYRLLGQLDCEYRQNACDLPALIVLDEANLSPLEHYWAPFLGACDSFATKPAQISLGGGQQLLVPRSLRFIATVNFDHTTEELSPRLLDRSWVISLDGAEARELVDVASGSAATPHELEYPAAFTLEQLEGAFCVPRTVPANYKTMLEAAFEICKNHGMPVSPRSQNMIRRYVGAASFVMERAAHDNNAPVDYALTQKLLPRLAGPEERMEALISDLLSIKGLPAYHARLERIQEQGAESGFYQFFA